MSHEQRSIRTRDGDFLHIPKAQGEPEIEPNGQTDDVGREPMALEGDWLHGHFPIGGPTMPRNGENLALD